MTPFHHPPPRLETRFALDRLGFFSAWANMGRKAECAQEVAYLVVVIPFVQTHALRMLFAWLRTLDHDALERRAHQFHIVAIGSINRQTDWHSMPFGEQAALHAALAPVGRIGAGFFPRPRALWLSPHPSKPVPVDAADLLKLLQSSLPQLEEDSCLHPLLKAIMRRRMRIQLGVIQGLLLVARA